MQRNSASCVLPSAIPVQKNVVCLRMTTVKNVLISVKPVQMNVNKWLNDIKIEKVPLGAFSIFIWKRAHQVKDMYTINEK